jgi:hypothetical protein
MKKKFSVFLSPKRRQEAVTATKTSKVTFDMMNGIF